MKMSFFEEIVAPVIGFIMLLVAIAALITGGVYLANRSGCERLHQLTGVETNVGWATGCMVKYKGAWVDSDVMTKQKAEVEVKKGE